MPAVVVGVGRMAMGTTPGGGRSAEDNGAGDPPLDACRFIAPGLQIQGLSVALQPPRRLS